MLAYLKRFVAVLLVVAAFTALVLPAAAQPPNLVVIVSDTRVLTGPGGSATNNVLRACQTFYLREISSDGQYARLFVTPSVSVWVSTSVVQDVPENYGQRNGTPATCSGAPLTVPTGGAVSTPVASATATAQPTQASSAASPVPTSSANTRITPNLVLVNTNTSLLSAPGGSSTGLNVRTCQTYFVVEVSADRQYYRLQITPNTTGWISAANVQDVAENYGQRNGEPRLPGC
ncbi:MAG: hypothetical protein SF123_03325 [Chloroflexota bacterium]|nr:hypothetical protein [Chloroflexota bacterium]